jgi:hypothetical protein
MVFVAAADADPVGKFVESNLNQIVQILSQPNSTKRSSELCQVVGATLDTAAIADGLLGPYGKLKRDFAGVSQFSELIPSLVVTRLVDAINPDDVRGGRVEVDSSLKWIATDLVEVTAHFYGAKGAHYTADIEVMTDPSPLIADINYGGFSAIDYMAHEFHRVLEIEFKKDRANSLPVTELVKLLKAEKSFVQCP